MSHAMDSLADYACHTGENPLYHPGENRVYWTDIPAGRLFRYDLATGEHEVCYEGDPVGGFTLQADGGLLLFQSKGTVRTLKDGVVTTVIEHIPVERTSRFNDVIADPEGRVFCGTMSSEAGPGRLYRLDTDGTLTLLLEGIGCSNGMGFTPDGKGFYYTDTGKAEIYSFDYDRASGAITNQKVLIKVERTPTEGAPDGMTVDSDGNIWSTRWDGSCMVCYNPSGEEIQRITFPVRKVSCATFGGADYADMFVTTAGGYAKDVDGPLAGAIFRVRIPGVRGVPEFVSRVGLSEAGE